MRLLTLLLALAAVPVAAGQDDVSAFVVGVQTPDGEPIVGASVLVGDNGASTDADGEAVVEGLRPGRYRVRVSFVGKVTREFAAPLTGAGPWGLIVELADSPVSLGDVVVEARDLSTSRMAADGFFDRIDAGSGTVLTIEDIERRAPILLTDLVRGSARASTSAARTASGRDVARGRRRRVPDGRVPRRDVLLVRERQPRRGLGPGRRRPRGLPPPTQVPLQYNQLGVSDGCGVILVWTALSLSEPGSRGPAVRPGGRPRGRTSSRARHGPTVGPASRSVHIRWRTEYLGLPGRLEAVPHRDP